MKDNYDKFLEISDKEYHSKDSLFLTSHKLIDFITCPYLYYQRHVAGICHKYDSNLFLVGRAVHTLVLEGHDKFNCDYTIDCPINPTTGKPYAPTTKCRKKVLPTDKWNFVKKIHAGVQRNSIAVSLLSRGRPELTLRGELNHFKIQARFDWLNIDGDKSYLVELKTCDSLNLFERDSKLYRYNNQIAFYRDFIKKETGIQINKCFLIAVEKQAPNRCGVWRCTEDLLDISQSVNEKALSQLSEAIYDDVWLTGYETLRTLGY